MFSEISVLATLLAVAANMILGFLWFSPMLFAKPWIKLSGMDKMNKAQMKNSMTTCMTISVVTSVIMAVVLSFVQSAMPTIVSPMDAVTLAVMLWVGFVATTFGTSYAYTQKSFALFIIDTGYPLVGMILMSVIVMWMK